MALPSTPRLDNLAAMQSRPLGTNTALYRDPTTEAMTRQYNQQRSDYNMARRLLRRQARRGSSEAAMGLINLGKDAEKEGVTFGMQNPDQRGAEIVRRVSDQKQATVDANQAAARVREESGLTPQTPRLDAAADSWADNGIRQIVRNPKVINQMAILRRPVDIDENMPEVKIAGRDSTRWEGMTDLGASAMSAAEELRDSPTEAKTLKFRQGLDRAISMTRTPEELQNLRVAAEEGGVSPEDFDKRSDWWYGKRRGTYNLSGGRK